MATLGEMLRDARDARGVSLEQAERETKIRQKYITALEDDNLAGLPGPVYARGFIRNYAIYLGLDPDMVLEIFDDQSQPTRHKIRAARGQAPPKSKTDKINIQPLSPEPIDTRVRFGTSYIAVSLLALPLIIVFYFVYSATAARPNGSVGLEARPTRAATFTALPIPSISALEPGAGAYNTPTIYVPQTPVAITITITPMPPVSLTPTSEPIPAADTVTVKITTTRDAWMRVLVDGVQQYSGTVPKDSTKEWEGDEIIRIRTGRADSVEVTVNGSDLGLMGDPDNLIVEKEWNREGEEEVISR